MTKFHKEIWVKIRRNDVKYFMAALGIPYKSFNKFPEYDQNSARYTCYKYINKGGNIETVTGVYDDIEFPTADPTISFMLDVSFTPAEMKQVRKKLL